MYEQFNLFHVFLILVFFGAGWWAWCFRQAARDIANYNKNARPILENLDVLSVDLIFLNAQGDRGYLPIRKVTMTGGRIKYYVAMDDYQLLEIAEPLEPIRFSRRMKRYNEVLQ